LRDAREYAQHALSNAANLRADALARAIQSQHAALYDLVIIGETLNRVSAAIKGAAPAMEWRGYSDLRNYIVHSYWQIDFEIIAEIVRNRLAPLIADLDTLIAFVERSER
jgi:uncharacterized protein with HEPN domain